MVISKISGNSFRSRSADTQLIRIFEKVRDIPFAVSKEGFSAEGGVAGMLKQNKGFCVPKHFYLAEMFEKPGIETKFAVYPFRWSDLGVDYPDGLKRLAEALPETFHLALKARINQKWVLVDATWDRALRKAGFPVNESWDGKSDMINAVKPLRGLEFNDKNEVEEIYHTSYSREEKIRLAKFSEKLNKWLSECRACSPNRP